MAIKRLNYFKGEFLQESDFTDEQQYHIDKIRKHNEKLHEWGIVDGLEVTQIGNTPSVSVSAGTAIDIDGNQLVQADSIPKNIPDESPQYLVISYHEEDKDPRNDTGIMENTRIEEIPDIEFLSSANPANQIILATVSLIDGSYEIDTSVRKYATAHIPDNAINSANIANNAITADKIAGGSVGTAKLADNAVTSAKLQSHSSTDASRAVTTDHIRNMAITTAKLATLSVGTTELKDNSVTLAKMADNAITSDKLAANSVGTSELIDGSVTNSKMAANSVSLDKMTSASVGTDELIDGSVTNPKIAAGAVTQNKIAPLSIGTAELANDAVTGAKMADSSVGTLELANGSVTAAKIAEQSVAINKLRTFKQYDSTYSIAANGTLALDLDELQDIAAFYLTSIYSITNGGTITWEFRSMMKQMNPSYGPMSYFYRTIFIRNLSPLIVNIRTKVYRIYEI